MRWSLSGPPKFVNLGFTNYFCGVSTTDWISTL